MKTYYITIKVTPTERFRPSQSGETLNIIRDEIVSNLEDVGVEVDIIDAGDTLPDSLQAVR